MGLLDRYHLRVKRPAPADFGDVAENVREIERWANILPIPAPQQFELPIVALAYSAVDDPLIISFDIALAHPNTVLCVDLFINVEAVNPGGGDAKFRIFIDGVNLDANIRATINEAAVHASVAIGYVTTIQQAGTHTLELHGFKTVNAGLFEYHGAIRLWVF